MNLWRELRKGWLPLGLCFLFLGLPTLWQARIAQLQNTVIWGASPKMPWMSPLQGYVAGILSVGLGTYLVVRGFFTHSDQ